MSQPLPTSDQPIELSVFSVVDHHPSLPRPRHQLYRQIIDQAVLAEELGYSCFLVAEHHFHDYGVVANPALMLSAIAQHTWRIRFGPAVVVLPFRHPLTVAEDYALLDHLSEGRLVMGVGSGHLAHEFEGFAIPLAEKRARFDEALAVLRQAWSDGQVTFNGRYFQLADVTLNVRPLQDPPPPIYVGVLRHEAAYYVGRQGAPLMSFPYAGMDRLEGVSTMLADYRRGPAESGGGGLPEPLFVFHTHVAPSDQAARREAASAFNLYVATRSYANRQGYDEVLRSGLALFGSVATVVDRLVTLHRMGVRHIAILQDFGALPWPAVARSMRLFAEEVIPELRARLAPAATGS